MSLLPTKPPVTPPPLPADPASDAEALFREARQRERRRRLRGFAVALAVGAVGVLLTPSCSLGDRDDDELERCKRAAIGADACELHPVVESGATR